MTDCIDCGEGYQDLCHNSQKECIHHCNHLWTHDSCCWCGLWINEEGELKQPLKGRGELVKLINFLRCVLIYGEHDIIHHICRRCGHVPAD